MIELTDVTTGYEKGRNVLEGLSLTLNDGSFYGIAGPNGSGKTTLLRTLAGILEYKGSIRIDDSELSHLKRKDLSKYIALMPQFSSLYFSYTVYDVVLQGRYVHSGSGRLLDLDGYSREDIRIAENAMEVTGLIDIKDRRLTELSGGQLQRVLLARTIAQDTPVILLDEPTNHLDIKYQKELMDYLSEWCKTDSRHTVLCAFHDISLAATLCDEMIIIKDGRLAINGHPSDILSGEMLRDIYDIDVVDYMNRQLGIWSTLK